MTPDEIDTLAQVFSVAPSLGCPNAEAKDDAHIPDGHQGPNDPHDYRIYRLLEIADICSSFYPKYEGEEEDRDPAERRYHSRHNLDDVAEFVREQGYELPEEITVAILRDACEFVRSMAKHETLRFGTEEVVNPCFGADIMETFVVPDGCLTMDSIYAAQQTHLADTSNDRTCSLEVFLPAERSGNTIRLKHVLQLCARMRDMLGHDPVFQIDSRDDHLVRLFFALKFVSEAFYDRYFLHRTTRRKSAGTVKRTNWKAFTTDANLFDAANNAYMLKCAPEPTGKIFRKECGYQVELRGITNAHHADIGERRVETTLTDVGGTPLRISLSNDETNMLDTPIVRLFTNFHLADPDNFVVKNFRDRFLTFSDTLKYALRRAGDWGQVEHAKRYGKVLFTSDILTALYAYYRNVRFVHLQRDDTHMYSTERGRFKRAEFGRYSVFVSRQ